MGLFREPFPIIKIAKVRVVRGYREDFEIHQGYSRNGGGRIRHSAPSYQQVMGPRGFVSVRSIARSAPSKSEVAIARWRYRYARAIVPLSGTLAGGTLIGAAYVAIHHAIR